MTYQMIEVTKYSIESLEYFAKKYKGIITICPSNGQLIINGMIPDHFRSEILAEIKTKFDSPKIWEIVNDDDGERAGYTPSCYMMPDQYPFD